jgi:hypothetical protein
MTNAKILLIDIENTPHEGYTWGTWEQNVIEVTQPAHLLSIAWKWLGDTNVQVRSLRSYRLYTKDRRNDRELAQEAHKLLSEADIVVAHNAKGHDIPFLNWRLMFHHLPPLTTYKIVDTLAVRKALVKDKAPSNSLNSVCKEQNYGAKLKHQGFELWKGCIEGDMEAWRVMEEYNAHDVRLLEEVYLGLRGWMRNHPKIAPTDGKTCPTCGGRGKSNGLRLSAGGIQYQRIRCYKCGQSWKGDRV